MKHANLPMFLSLFIGFGALVLGPANSLWAQTTTSVIEGTVRDSTGGALAGASVEVRGATVTRTVVSGDDGRYLAPALPAGTYEVRVSLDGFQGKKLEGVVLFLNRTLTLDVELEVAAVAEQLTVLAQVPAIDFKESSSRQVIDSQTIDSIPLNNRNYLDLIRLTPGVVVNDNARSDLTNRDTRGAMLGERAGNAAFLIEGHENSNDFHGGVFLDYNQDSIQEFEVIQTGYKAEFGRGSGGIINVITKSGTNDLAGSGFFFVRNDALDSSNVEGEEAPKLRRFDAGFTLGGPLAEDKSWFFGSVEHIVEDRAALFPQDIPDLLAAAEDFSRQPESTNTRIFGKWTLRVNDRNDLRADVGWSRVEGLNELADSTSLPSHSINSNTKTWNANATLTSFFSPRAFLESSFNLRDQSFGQNQEGGQGGVEFGIAFLDEGSWFSFGPPLGSVQTLDQRYYGLRETLSFFTGNHSAKAGFQYLRTRVDGMNGQGLQRVIVTVKPLFELFGTDSFQIPQGVAFLEPGDELSRLRNNGISLFVQDDWTVGENLTLNLGVRWDYDSKFNDKNNVAPRVGLAWRLDSKTVVQASWGIFYDRYRLGIAQPVPEFGGFNGVTVVETNYPRLAADALLPFPGTLGLIGVVLQDPFLLHNHYGIPLDAVVTRDNIETLTGLAPDAFLSDLNAFLGTLGIGFNPVEFSLSTGFLSQDMGADFVDQIRVARPFTTPHNNTVTVGFQREVSPGLSLGARYVHRKIENILGVRIPNLAPEAREVGRPITADGGPLQRTYGPWYDGTYDAFIVLAEKRFGNRFQFQTNYTYAEATDNLLNSNLGLGIGTQGGGGVPTDNLDLEVDRGDSDFGVRHNFVLSGLVSLPGDFWVSGVLRLRSGVKFSAAGPPNDVDGDGISSTRPASTKRNEFTGPSVKNLDLRVEKKIRFGDRYQASVLIEFFNLTNAANPAVIDNFFVDGSPGDTFGTTRIPLPGREIQLGFRFVF